MSMSNYPFNTDTRSDIRTSKSDSDIRTDILLDIHTSQSSAGACLLYTSDAADE